MANMFVAFLDILLVVFRVLLFARIITSWLPALNATSLAELLYALTEPVLRPVRSLVVRSPLGGPGMIFDVSPIIALVLLHLAHNVLVAVVLALF